MQLIVQNIWMANTPSSAKARHSPSIRLCLVWSSYFIFGNLKKGRKKNHWFGFAHTGMRISLVYCAHSGYVCLTLLLTRLTCE